jgi:site-specific recombinase XerD
MASLQQRGNIYYIVFSKRIDGKLYQKKFSLGTSDLKEAKSKKYDFEKQYELGRIDPFNGWTPKQEQHRSIQERKNSSYVTLSDLAKLFVEERSQANTVTKKNYKRHLDMMAKQVGKTMPVKMITEKDIRKFCFRSTLRTATQASYLRHLKVFFRWLKENNHVDQDVTAQIKPPKINDRISGKIISEKELERIFTAYRQDILKKRKLRQIVTEAQSRSWFRPVVMTAFYGGLRRKEIVNLEWGQINFDQKYITVTESKSGKERTIPIRSKLFQILKAWHRKEGQPTSGLVFPSKKAYTENTKMSKSNITKVFKKYALKAQLSKSVNFHGLRHSCATELLKMGLDINEVSKILGHSSLEITKVYEHLTAGDLKDKLEKIEAQHENTSETSEELMKQIKALKRENARLRNEMET